MNAAKNLNTIAHIALIVVAYAAFQNEYLSTGFEHFG